MCELLGSEFFSVHSSWIKQTKKKEKKLEWIKRKDQTNEKERKETRMDKKEKENSSKMNKMEKDRRN
jgi:hypothetical protein